jgi:PAS domain S-box-containing protein
LPLAVYTCDPQGRVTSFNRAAEVLWGRTPQVGVDRWCGSLRVFRPDGTPLPTEACPMAIAISEGRAVRGQEILIERPDGSRRHVMPSPEPIRDEHDRLVGAINVLVDVTDQRRAESELAALRDDLRHRVAGMDAMHDLSMQLAHPLELSMSLDAILGTLAKIHGADRGLLLLHNPTSGRLEVAATVGLDSTATAQLGGLASQAQGGPEATTFAARARTVIENVDHDKRYEKYAPIARALGFRATHSTPILTRDGDILGVLSVLFNAERRPTDAEMQFTDMCARYAAGVVETARTQQDLRESDSRFRQMADHAPVLIWVHGLDGREFVNREYLRFIGGTFEDVRGDRWLEAVHPEDRQQYLEAYLNAFDRQESFEAQMRLRRHDGVYRWLRSTGSPRFTPGGRFIGYIGCSVDITDIKASEEALRVADRRKDEFLATLAHELRNPLAPLRNALQILRLAERDDHAELHAMMDRQLDHLVRLVDDLMEVSRITRGRIDLRRERVLLSTILRGAIETTQPLIDAAGHRLHVEMPEEPVILEADGVRLVQVFANLLSNATKYTDPGGEIWVSARGDRDRVRVSVRDTGVGISSEVLPRIFDLFIQGDNAPRQPRASLGIGLTIVRHLVEMHGGTVSARSAGVRRGSEFVVTLPILAGNTNMDLTETPTARRGQLAGHQMLVVDDSKDGADSLVLILQMLGADVRVAYDATSALELLNEYQPTIMLLDIGLPGMDGYELARRIRQRPGGTDPLLIALTGWGQFEDRERSAAAGFDRHLVKPLEIDDLLSVLDRGSLGSVLREADSRPPAAHRC